MHPRSAATPCTRLLNLDLCPARPRLQKTSVQLSSPGHRPPPGPRCPGAEGGGSVGPAEEFHSWRMEEYPGLPTPRAEHSQGLPFSLSLSLFSKTASQVQAGLRPAAIRLAQPPQHGDDAQGPPRRAAAPLQAENFSIDRGDRGRHPLPSGGTELVIKYPVCTARPWQALPHPLHLRAASEAWRCQTLITFN